jgi:hypothetical protein
MFPNCEYMTEYYDVGDRVEIQELELFGKNCPEYSNATRTKAIAKYFYYRLVRTVYIEDK